MVAPSPAELLDDSIERAGFTILNVPVQVPSPGKGATVTVTVNHPDAARAAVMKLQDRSGATTFHLPVEQDRQTIEPQCVFRIPSARLVPFDVAGQEQLLSPLPTATLLATSEADLVGDGFVAWYTGKEEHDHPHRIRYVVTQDGRFAPGVDVTDWSALDGKTVLLFVHGVLSSSQNCFHGLRADLVDSLLAVYPAVLCFDHPTVAVDPRDNVRWFLDQIPPEINLRFRIIAHSRGGIVARILAGGLAEIAVRDEITVETIALAGTPNLGTPIVSVAKWGALVDRLANLAAFLPGPFHDPGEFIADVLQLLKGGADKVITQLPGLAFMLNGQTSGVLFDLDSTLGNTTNHYYAVDTEFRPDEVLWHIFDLHRDADDATAVLVDNAVFDHVPHDIAVPTSGVRGAGLSGGGFPITAGLSFGESDTVWHCSYFDDELTWRSLREWFLDEAVG